MKTTHPLVAAGALLAAAPAAQAAVDLAGGTTQLTLDKGTARRSPGSASRSRRPARRRRGPHVTFPVTGGASIRASAAGTIGTAAGCASPPAARAITLEQLRRRASAAGSRCRPSVGGGRVTILDLTGTPQGHAAPASARRCRGLTAQLNRTAARALNAAFGVDAFRKGLQLGTVPRARRAVRDGAARPGATALAIDPAALQAIVGQGITPGVIAPGHARRAPRRASRSPAAASALDLARPRSATPAASR